MIITDKSDVFQKLLKDVEDLKIIMKPHTEHGTCAIRRGAWVQSKYSKRPFKFGSWEKDGRIYDVNGFLRKEKLDYLEIMSDREIESYLIKEAQKKGLCGWRKFKWENEPEVSTMVTGLGYEYVRSVDALTVAVGGWDDRRAIYMDGKWALPVFDCTEPPKTVSELECLLKDFCKDIYGSDSLCEIYTDVDNFLRKHGYK